MKCCRSSLLTLKKKKKVDLFVDLDKGYEKCVSKSQNISADRKAISCPTVLTSLWEHPSHVNGDVLVIFIIAQAFWTLGASTASSRNSLDHGSFFMFFCWCFGLLLHGVLSSTQAVSQTEKSSCSAGPLHPDWQYTCCSRFFCRHSGVLPRCCN